jgi:hypothetical protein
MFSARLAQRAAQSRRMIAHDLTAELTTPPDWGARESWNSPIYGDLARLFRLLDSSNAASAVSTESSDVDISVLSNRSLVLNHAERRIAQLALLNLMRDDAAPQDETRALLLGHFIRLHPLRAIRFGFRALWDTSR